jgi:hypothetical protein
MEWQDAVLNSIKRLCRAKKRKIFTRKELIRTQLSRIIADTKCTGGTPDQTLSRVLQELRDAGEIEFVARGVYRRL